MDSNNVVFSARKYILFLAIICLASLSVRAQSAEDSYKTGSDLCDKSQFEAAIPYFDKAIALNPSKAEYYNGRSRAYLGVNKIDKALADCNKALSIDTLNPYIYNNRGRAYYAQALYDKAFIDFNKAVQLGPKYMSSSYTNIGYIFNIRQQYDQAIKSFSSALAISPAFTDALTGRANAYSQMGRTEEAIKDCDAALKISPDIPYAYYLRGYQYFVKNQFGLAMSDYNKCIELRPKVADGYFVKGNLYSKMAQWDLAINEYTTALQLYPNYAFSLNMRALANLAKGNYEAAITDLKKAISLDPKKQYSNYVLNIIEPLGRLNRFSEAASYWKLYQTEYPKGYVENATLAYFKKYLEAITLYLPENKFNQALTTLEEADKLYKVQSEPGVLNDSNFTRRTYSSLLTLRGYILMKMNKADDAKKAYSQSILINPSQPDVREALQILSQNKILIAKTDKESPKLLILEPANNSRSISIGEDKSNGALQRIRGKATDASGISSIKINNKPIPFETNGYFETTVPVAEGVNSFSISVTDNNANSYIENIQLFGAKIKPKSNSPGDSQKDELKDEPKYHAILIAETNYRDNTIKSLERPEMDLNVIYDILVNRYSFPRQNVIKLLNPGRIEILETIMKKANDLTENDNLLIFYAGHGEMIKLPNNKEEGFLLPSDAIKGSQVSYIRGEELIRTFEFSKARHILVLADACFAGSLLRNIESEAEASVVEAYKDQSRKIMASGNRTTVPDESVFIADLRTAFLNNRKKYITAEQLLNSFKEDYINKTRLNPQYYPISGLDLGGQFVFKRSQ